jgi:hypothetical protein
VFLAEETGRDACMSGAVTYPIRVHRALIEMFRQEDPGCTDSPEKSGKSEIIDDEDRREENANRNKST